MKAATGEEVTQEELGGAMPHATKSGVANFVYDDEETCLEQVRYLVSFLPSNNLEDAPVYDTDDAPDRSCDRIVDIMPDSPNQAYDMKEVIADVVDDGDFLEVSARFGMNIVCGFGRLGGQSVGIVGNQPKMLAGALDIDASEKAARFVRTCDAFNIPLITFVDVPGFIPGTNQEHGGIIRHGAKLLYAYCESTVPRIQVITRKGYGGAYVVMDSIAKLLYAYCESTVPRIQVITRKGYGGAYVVMDSKSIGSDIAYAWPTAEIAVMNSHGAANILLRRELAESDDPVARKAQWDEEYSERFANPYNAAERPATSTT